MPHRLIWLLILAEIVLFGAAGYLTYRFVEQTRASRAWVAQSQQILTTFVDLRITNSRLSATALYYVNGDTGQRWSEMRLGIEDVRRLLAELPALIGDDPVQLGKLEVLARQVESRMGSFERLLDEVPPGDPVAARPIITELSRNSDPMRIASAAFTANERYRLAERNKASDLTLQRTLMLLVGALAGVFLFGGVATLLFLNRLRLQRAQWLELARANAETARQMEESRSTRRRLNAVLDNARDGIMLVAPDDEITIANGACAPLLGLAREQIMGRRLAEFLPGLAVQDGGVWRMQAARADGSTVPVEVSAGLCQLDEGPATVCVLRDNTARQRLEQIKDDFVSTVSHELRTPLTSIRGSLGLIVGRAAGELPPKAQALLEIAHKNSERLIDLVNDLLDIEKIETHRIAMRRDRVEIRRLVEATVEANQDLARQAGVEIAVEDRATAPPLVLGDFGRLQQVLTNLISNAVKFSPAHERVLVTIDGGTGRVTVSVRDFGPGIPDEFQPHVFKRFAQAESGDTRRRRGTGLGLSIVKAIVEHHGGSLGFESPLPGNGTCFWFSLDGVEDAGAAVTEAASCPRVLICEDNALVAHLMEAIVEKDGWCATTVATAEAALKELATQRFAAMTVDLRLPQMSGIDLIRRVGADERHRAMPIVVVSAFASSDRDQLDGYAAKLVDWIEKPFDEARLRQVLLSAVEGRSQASALRILHVENDEDLVTVVREVIGTTAEVETAPSLNAARELLGQRRFDLVILDVQLPDGNGLDLVPLLRSTQREAALLILSADDVPEGGFGMIQASLTKGRTDNAHLAQTIGRLLGRARQHA